MVREGNALVRKIVASSKTPTSALDEYVDFVELAKRALGKEWSNLSRPQQDEFGETMRGLLRASYPQKMIGTGENTVYGAEKVTGNEAVVATTVTINKDSIPVEYGLFRTDDHGRWKIYDVSIDGVSLVATYRDQFRQVISRNGYDALLSTLKSRRAQLEAPAKKTTQVLNDAR